MGLRRRAPARFVDFVVDADGLLRRPHSRVRHSFLVRVHPRRGVRHLEPRISSRFIRRSAIEPRACGRLGARGRCRTPRGGPRLSAEGAACAGASRPRGVRRGGSGSLRRCARCSVVLAVRPSARFARIARLPPPCCVLICCVVYRSAACAVLGSAVLCTAPRRVPYCDRLCRGSFLESPAVRSVVLVDGARSDQLVVAELNMIGVASIGLGRWTCSGFVVVEPGRRPRQLSPRPRSYPAFDSSPACRAAGCGASGCRWGALAAGARVRAVAVRWDGGASPLCVLRLRLAARVWRRVRALRLSVVASARAWVGGPLARASEVLQLGQSGWLCRRAFEFLSKLPRRAARCRSSWLECRRRSVGSRADLGSRPAGLEREVAPLAGLDGLRF